MIVTQIAQIIAGFVFFLEANDDETLDPDAAVEMMEELGAGLQALDKGFLRELVEAFAAIAPGYREWQQLISDIPYHFYLEEVLAANDPARLAELAELRDAREANGRQFDETTSHRNMRRPSRRAADWSSHVAGTTEHRQHRGEDGGAMIVMQAARIIADFIIFLDMTDDDTLNPDTAVHMMETLAVDLEGLDKEFLRQLIDAFPVIAGEYSGEAQRLVLSIPSDFGLEEAFADDDPMDDDRP